MVESKDALSSDIDNINRQLLYLFEVVNKLDKDGEVSKKVRENFDRIKEIEAEAELKAKLIKVLHESDWYSQVQPHSRSIRPAFDATLTVKFEENKVKTINFKL